MPPSSRFLLDTNVVIRLARRDALGRWIEANYPLTGSAPVPLISMVTDGELRSLALAFGWGAAKRQELQNIVNRMVVVPLDFPGLLDAYATIDVSSQQQGRKMGKNDVWIAATAHVTSARLLTTD